MPGVQAVLPDERPERVHVPLVPEGGDEYEPDGTRLRIGARHLGNTDTSSGGSVIVNMEKEPPLLLPKRKQGFNRFWRGN